MNKEAAQRITAVEKWKSRKGKSELLKAINEQVLTARQAINAKCYDCTCGYDGGAEDCGVAMCPLYQFMPFRKGGARKQVRSEKQIEALSKNRNLVAK